MDLARPVTNKKFRIRFMDNESLVLEAQMVDSKAAFLEFTSRRIILDEENKRTYSPKAIVWVEEVK